MYDLTVIGGGPGGYAAALRAAQLGARVALVEVRDLGGTCLNVGCIPSKVMLHAAGLIRAIRSAPELGIQVGEPQVDFVALMERQVRVVSELTSGVQGLLRSAGVQVHQGRGELLAPGRVQVTGPAGSTLLESSHVILATGSRPARPPIPGLDLPEVHTTDTFWGLRVLPREVAIIGGGVVGVEFADFLSALGVRTTVLEMLPSVLGQADPELAQQLVRSLESEGVTIRTAVRVTEIATSAGRLHLHLSGPGGSEQLGVDAVILATGRSLNIDRESMDRLGIGYGPAGIQVDDRMRTGVDGIFAVGDVAGGALAHVATAQAVACVEAIFGEETHYDPRSIPAVVYTHPELAWAGLTEQEAKAKGIPCRVSTFPFAASGRAHTMGSTVGMVKMVAAENGDVLGVHILGHHAGELIQEAALALTLGATAWELAHTIHAHPTLGEGIQEAAHGLLGGALHLPRSRRPNGR